jgi:hypothetical protein
MLEEIKRVISLLPYTDNHLPEIFSGICSVIIFPIFWKKEFGACDTWMLYLLISSGIITIAGSLASSYRARRIGAITSFVISTSLLISSIRNGQDSSVAAVMLCTIAFWNYFKSGFEMSIRSKTK